MPPPANRRMTPAEWGFLFLIALIWGASFFFTTAAAPVVGPITTAAVRVALAAAVLVAVLLAQGAGLPRDPAAWRLFLAMATLNNAVPFALLGWAQMHIAGGLASILNATTPFFGALIAHVVTTDEKLTANRLVGVVIGVFGAAVMIGLSVMRDIGGQVLGVDVLAELACVAAAICYGTSNIIARGFARARIAPMTAAAGQLTAATVLLVPAALIVDRPFDLPFPGWPILLQLAGLALISTALAYVLFFRLLAAVGATNAMLVTLLVPVSAILLGLVFHGEVLAPRHVFGLVLIALGLSVIDGRLWQRLRRRR